MNDVIFVTGVSALVPASGFKDLYNDFNTSVGTLAAAFTQATIAY